MFIHLVLCTSTWSLLGTVTLPCLYMARSVYPCLGCFHLLPTVGSGAVHIHVQVSFYWFCFVL